MTMLLVFLFASLFTSFMCSLLEAVILSVTPAFIAVEVRQAKKSGLKLKELRDNLDRPIAAILTLNTIAHTIGAAGVGAQAQKIWGDESVAIASGVMTFLILVLSEIIPKTIGASNWKALAPASAILIQWMIYLTYPFVRLSELLSTVFKNENDGNITREEMIETAELGFHEGALKKKESLIIKNLLMLSTIYVSDIMTPRSVIFALEDDSTVEDVLETYKPVRFSRIPVYHEDLDQILGVVNRYKILEASSRDKDKTRIKDLITPVHTIPEDVPVSAALDQMIQRQEHLFVVVDEYGSTAGIVTLEDAVETLLGVEIVDEFDSVADLRQYALEQWKHRKKVRGPNDV